MFGGSFFGDDDDRDERRSFNTTEKRAILECQNGKCGICKMQLDFFKAHFHHKKAWSAGGCTKVSNGIALCPNCHADIHSKERLNKYKKQIKPTTPTKKTAAKKTTAKAKTTKKAPAKKKRRRSSDDDDGFGGLFNWG